MQIQPYLFFDGRCEEAAAFYRDAVGAEVQFSMRFKDSPDGCPPGMPPGSEDKPVLVVGPGDVAAEGESLEKLGHTV
jgi:uncharacterized glyoxalase superfamily protein PhnB